MKNLFLLVTFIFSISTYGQLNSNYEKGFKDGYCQAKKEDKGQYTTCATSPRAPSAKVGKESYQDGFSAGYKKYGGNGSSSSETQKMLIQGAKDVSPKFVDVGAAFMKGFNSTYKKPIKYPLGDSDVEIIENLKVNLNDFTHIAIVEAPYKRRWSYNDIEKVLISSQLEVINPAYKKNKKFKKQFRKNPLFLKSEKNESWLYLSIMSSSKVIKGLRYNTSYTILRDSKNKIVYKAKEVNTTYEDGLEFLINF
jgi:hypothetical protein